MSRICKICTRTLALNYVHRAAAAATYNCALCKSGHRTMQSFGGGIRPPLNCDGSVATDA